MKTFVFRFAVLSLTSVTFSAWQVQPVDSNLSQTYGTGGIARIAVSGDGTPWIAFYRNFSGVPEGLYVSHKNTDGWTLDRVDTSTGSSIILTHTIVIAMDGNDQPHVVYGYNDPVYSNLRHAWKDAQGWHKEEVTPAKKTGSSISLAIGRDGSVHATYFPASYGNKPCYCKRNPASGVWSVDTAMDAWGSMLGSAAVAVDTAGAPHIVAPGVYWTKGTNGWQKIAAPGVGMYPVIRIATTGIPYIFSYGSYSGSGTTSLALSSYGGGQWSTAVAKPPASSVTPTDPHMVLDKNDKAHAAYRYFNATSQATHVVYTTNAGGSWTGDSLTSGDNGLYDVSKCDLAVDNGGNAHVVTINPIPAGGAQLHGGAYALLYYTNGSAAIVNGPSKNNAHAAISDLRVHVRGYRQIIITYQNEKPAKNVIRIFSVNGALLARLYDNPASAGFRTVNGDMNSVGGTFVFSLESDGVVQGTKKKIVLW
jgi:hypothetical protein